MPCSAHSCAADCVKARTPNFEELYTPRRGKPLCPAMEQGALTPRVGHANPGSQPGKRDDPTRWQERNTPRSSVEMQSSCIASPRAPRLPRSPAISVSHGVHCRPSSKLRESRSAGVVTPCRRRVLPRPLSRRPPGCGRGSAGSRIGEAEPRTRHPAGGGRIFRRETNSRICERICERNRMKEPRLREIGRT